VFPKEVHDTPAAVPLLDVSDRQRRHLGTSKAAAQQHGEDRAVPETFAGPYTGGQGMNTLSRISTVIGLAVASASVVASQQADPDHVDLAYRLAGKWVRLAAVQEVAASAAEMTPVLLSWTTKPPAGVDTRELDVGLADAFGRMKTEAAIPFLIKIIGLERDLVSIAPWLKTPDIIEKTYPAAAALIRIGPAGASAVIKAADGPMTHDDRLLAIFVVARTKGVPEARVFLTRAVGWANIERYEAEEGIKALEP